MALAGFAPTNFGTMSAGVLNASQAIPGGAGTTLVITNVGPGTAFVNLTTGAGTVTSATGIAVTPYAPVALTVGSATYINAIGMAGISAVLNLAQGT